MTPRLDLTPAPISLPRISPPKHGRAPVEWVDRPTPDGRGPQGVLIPARDFGAWLTREAILLTIYAETESSIEDDRDAAQCWIMRDAAKQVGLTHGFIRSLDDVRQLRRMLRERRGGAQ
jgi:hypothetical protein